MRDRRTAPVLTQAELTDSCGLHRSCYGSVERSVSGLNLRSIARAPRMSRPDLFANPAACAHLSLLRNYTCSAVTISG
ncbi:MAG TPA: hypothetical protein VKE74_27100 [Gemmataceae bacterium]|nr:hypothetical protein [Gemmataceae bacterium]